MENCLVTKLKGVVDNDNLPIFDTIVLNVSQKEEYTAVTSVLLIGGDGNSYTIKTSNGGYFGYSFATVDSDHVTELTINDSAEHQLYFSNGNYKVYISGKYNLIELATEYITNHGEVSIFNFELSQLTNTKLEIINITGAQVSGNVTEFPNTVTSVGFSGNAITGNLKDIPNRNLQYLKTSANTIVSENLSEIGAAYPQLIEYYTQRATGDVLDYVAARINGGKATCSGTELKFAYLKYLHFNGKSWFEAYRGYLTWESANKIAWVNIEAQNVYSYGYTDQEIANNTATGGIWAGRTVIKMD